MIFAIILTAMLVGIYEGGMDYLQFHYKGTSQFLQPASSWRNKWKDGDPLKGEKFWQSSRLLVFTTDGWHLCKFLRNISIMSCIALLLIYTGQTLLCAICIVLLLRLIYGIGFYFGYIHESN